MPLPTPPTVVPEPEYAEQIRLLAESVKNIYQIIHIIYDNADKFIPGESVEEFKNAWSESQATALDKVVRDLLVARNENDPLPGYGENGLLGAPGKMKISMIRRLKDKFLEMFNISGVNKLKALADYLECSENLIKSIPGVGHAAEEFISATKQLVRISEGRTG